MGALFPIKCPHCGKPTAVTPEVFHRWWPVEGRSELAASLPGKVHADQKVRAVFASLCPTCDGPLALTLTMKGAVLSALVSRPGVPSAKSLESLEPSDVFEVKVDPPKPSGAAPLVVLHPGAPKTFADKLRHLAEDAVRPDRGATAAAGCRWLLDEILTDLGYPPAAAAKPAEGLFSRLAAAIWGAPPRPTSGLEIRLKKACAAQKLPKWALEHAKSLDLEATTAPKSATPYVNYLAAVLRAAYPGIGE